METDIRPPGIEAAPLFIAGFWRRAAAFLLDYFVILGGISGIVVNLFFFAPLARMGGGEKLLGFALALLYFGLQNSALAGGRTLGKRLMNIEAVGRDGKPVSVGRSFLRAALLGGPLFLCGVQFVSPAGEHLLLPTFGLGVGAAILYLAVFDRVGRQGAHDWAAGTWVVESLPSWNPAGRSLPSGAPWKGHRIIALSLFLFFSLGGAFVFCTLPHKPKLVRKLALRRAILATGDVAAVELNWKKTTTRLGGEAKTGHAARVKAWWRERPVDFEADAREVAAVLIREAPRAEDAAILSVTVAYGYDLGFTSRRVEHTYVRTWAQWRRSLNPEAVPGPAI